MKSIICLHCKKEIEYSRFTASVSNSGDFTISNGEFDTKDYGDWEDIEHFCPECEEDITKEIEQTQ